MENTAPSATLESNIPHFKVNFLKTLNGTTSTYEMLTKFVCKRSKTNSGNKFEL